MLRSGSPSLLAYQFGVVSTAIVVDCSIVNEGLYLFAVSLRGAILLTVTHSFLVGFLVK